MLADGKQRAAWHAAGLNSVAAAWSGLRLRGEAGLYQGPEEDAHTTGGGGTSPEQRRLLLQYAKYIDKIAFTGSKLLPEQRPRRCSWLVPALVSVGVPLQPGVTSLVP